MKNSTMTLRGVRSSEVHKVINALNFLDISPSEGVAILKIAVLFLNSNVEDVRELGYRLLLKYSVKSGNYIPLYDVASCLGFIPIASLLDSSDLLPPTENFLHCFMGAYRETFKHDDAFQTEMQKQLFSVFKEMEKETIAVVAPTSYGKSQLIEQTIENQISKNIAIVVPSKALISQTRRRVVQKVKNDMQRQVIVHHDMLFDQKKPIIAVVTQERLLRLFQKHRDLAFDVLFIDEAHNLLSRDKRSKLLASSIIIGKIRNKALAVKYLTPFLVTSDSLQMVTGGFKIKEIKITEKLKTEDYFICDINSDGCLKQYDQFLNKFYAVPENYYPNEHKLLLSKQQKKNIVYLNRPKDIESYSEQLAKYIRNISNASMEKVCKEISEYVHPDYRLLRCLKKGVVYHHGSVPDIVRLYVENAFRQNASITWIVTNSTLLEGVNIPADNLFILDNRKGKSYLTPPQFRNLVGRVNRFSEIFDPDSGTPHLLIPSIYLIASQFSHSKLNVEKYIQRVAKVDLNIEDQIKNPLLSGSGDSEEVIVERNVELNYIENIEPDAPKRPESRLSDTEVGRLCFIHNIFEFDVLENELDIETDVEHLVDNGIKVSDPLALMKLIAELFLSRIPEDADNVNLTRLSNEYAQKFYAMFFEWRMNQVNYKVMISNFVKYWKSLRSKGKETIVFAGRWGNIQRNGYMPYYIDVDELEDFDLVNLAIVRIKEEQDFIDNNIVKYLEVLHDLDLLDNDLYNSVKYGTTDVAQIALVRSGFSHIAANVLISKYRNFIEITEDGNVIISPDITQAFSVRNEKELIAFEVLWSGLLAR